MKPSNLKGAIRLREAGQHSEARAILLELLSARPKDPILNYQCAWVHDALGRERAAIPYYERAIRYGLRGADLEGALLGLGSSYRCVGAYKLAIKTLARGQKRFSKSRQFDPFLAMAHFNAGNRDTAMEILLRCVAQTSKDPGIVKYKRAIEFYADKLDKIYN